MISAIRSQVVLALVVSLVGVVGFAQSSGEAIYKAKCQSCHGATGMADTTVGKALKVKPVTNPEVKKASEAAMIEATKNGMGKMQPYKGKLTEAEIKGAVDHFRSLIK
jgi:cytochrome c6